MMIPVIMRPASLLVSVSLALSLGACQHTRGIAADPSSLTPAQRELRQRDEALNSTVWQGVLVGAATGAVAGALVDSSNRGMGALIGGALGALIGGAAGNYLSSLQANAASRIDVAEKLNADITKKNVEAQSAIQAAQTVLDEDRRKLASLQAELRNGTITREKYAAEITVLQADRNEIKETTKNLGDQIKVFSDVAKKIDGTGGNPRQGDTKARLDEINDSYQKMSQISAMVDQVAPSAGTEG